MANHPISAEFSSRTAVAGYVATLSAELAALTRKTDMETLTYLLEMVRLEAQNEIQRANGSG